MSRLGGAFVSAALSLALFGLGRFLFNLLGLRVFGPVVIGHLNVSISTWTLVAVMVATVPSVVASKYVSEFLASHQETRAARVLAGCLGITWLLSAAIVLWLAATRSDEVVSVWPLYGVIYATYLVFRSAYFSHQRARAVLGSELLGFFVFACLLTIALVSANAVLASIALASQPAVYCLKGLWDFRADIRFRGAFAELQDNRLSYGVFSGATLANALTGMASYHLSIVLAGKLVQQPSDVGFLSVLLSTMSPINLVPQALGAVLFAEFARRHGSQQEQDRRAVALRATILVQIFVLFTVGNLIAFPDFILHRVGLPVSSTSVITWTWLVYTLGLTITSSPCGHLLNATRYAPHQALAPVLFLVFGVSIGVWSMPHFGIVAAGWMRFGVDGGLAWTRMAIAQSVEPWIDRRWADLAVFQLTFGGLFLQGIAMNAGWIRMMTLFSGVLVLMILAKRELKQLYAGIRWQRN